MKPRLQSLLAAALCAAAIASNAQGLGSGSLFARVNDQATKVTEAYAAIYEGFYGVGKARALLKAALDVRPDGTPNITLDRGAGKAQFTIRLSVDEPAYNAWKADAHRRIESIGMSVKFSDFEDTEARVIGGKFYRLGDNEESALRRWEESEKPPKKAELVVRVEFVDSAGEAVRTVDIPIKQFRRLGFDAYPIPLHHLNRLRDLPLDRFQWGSLDGMRRSLTDALRRVDPDARIEGDSVEAIRRALEKAEANLAPEKRYKWGDVEDAYAAFTLTGLTDDFLNSVADVRCTVIDDATLVPEREEAARIAREREETARREREEAARIAREREETARREREKAARIAREREETARREREEAARIAGERAAPEIIKNMVPIPGKNYRMGKYEVTQAQWEAVMGANPSEFKGANNPVENVSWNDCQEFLRKLNALPTVKASGLTFRLPTVEEWEYACRAGAKGKYCKLADGTEITKGTLGQVAWFNDNSDTKTHPVGQKQPNAFGLYDMPGNVGEWTSTAVGEFRVRRGGCWLSSAGNCESSFRLWDSPSFRSYSLGFRLCASGKAD